MTSRRVLITGVSSPLGGRLAHTLESDDNLEAVVGVDTTYPRQELARTEFVRVDTDHRTLRRILSAAAIDTVVDTRLIADPLLGPPKHAHEVNVAGTASLLAACAASDSPVRKLVFKSSAHYYGCEADDPAFFSEEMTRSRPPRTSIERDVLEAEAAMAEVAGPARTITILRLAEEIGGGERSSQVAMLTLPVVPTMLGFDPRWQFVHHDDVIAAFTHAVRHELPGAYNVAADGVLALSELVSLLGKPQLPVLPPWGAGFAATQLRRLGLPMPVELLRQLKFGRGLDNRRLKASGFTFKYTSREAILKLRAQQRLRPLLRSGGEPYRYERELEEFLRWSPAVRGAAASGASGNGPPLPGRDYDQLSAAELIEVVPSLEAEALRTLRRYEEAHQARASVLEVVDRTLARKGAG